MWISVNENLNKQVLFILLPANFLMGILAIMGSALAGSDQAIFPISVMTTVGLIALTLIYW